MGIRKREKAEHKKGDRKKLAAVAAATVVLTTGAAVHESFDPEELLRAAASPAHVETVKRTASNRVVLAELPDETRALSRGDALRARIIRLPVWVKTAVLLPLWAVGSLPAALLGALSPVWSALLGVALQAGVLMGLFCLVYKLLFPKRKVRELFRRKNLRWLLLGAVALTAADMVLAQVWPEWTALRFALLLAAGFLVLALLYKRLCGALRAPEPEIVKTRLVAELQ